MENIKIHNKGPALIKSVFKQNLNYKILSKSMLTKFKIRMCYYLLHIILDIATRHIHLKHVN